MPRGVHTSKRPSGCQQRKARKKRCESLKSLPGSMLQYVKKAKDDHGSSEDIPESTIATDLSDASSTQSVELEEQIVQEIKEIDAEIHGMEVDELEAEVDADNDSNHNTENVMMCQINEENGIFYQMFLSGIYQFKIIFGLKLLKKEVLLFRTRMGHLVLRQGKMQELKEMCANYQKNGSTR